MICTQDSGKYSQKGRSDPITNWVTEEIDLLFGAVLSPEADTAEQERPRVRLSCVRVAGGQRVVVIKHGTLEFDVFHVERKVLYLLLLFEVAWGVFWNTGNVIDIPNVAGLLSVFVAIDFSLFERPLRQRGCVSPHGHLGWEVDKFELAGLGLERSGLLSLFQLDLEQSIVMAISRGNIQRDGGEFLICGMIGRCNIMSH